MTTSANVKSKLYIETNLFLSNNAKQSILTSFIPNCFVFSTIVNACLKTNEKKMKPGLCENQMLHNLWEWRKSISENFEP